MLGTSLCLSRIPPFQCCYLPYLLVPLPLWSSLVLRCCRQHISDWYMCVYVYIYMSRVRKQVHVCVCNMEQGNFEALSVLYQKQRTSNPAARLTSNAGEQNSTPPPPPPSESTNQNTNKKNKPQLDPCLSFSGLSNPALLQQKLRELEVSFYSLCQWFKRFIKVCVCVSSMSWVDKFRPAIRAYS